MLSLLCSGVAFRLKKNEVNRSTAVKNLSRVDEAFSLTSTDQVVACPACRLVSVNQTTQSAAFEYISRTVFAIKRPFCLTTQKIVGILGAKKPNLKPHEQKQI